MATAFVSSPVGARLGLHGSPLSAGTRKALRGGARTPVVLQIAPCRATTLRRLHDARVRVSLSALEPLHGTRVTGNVVVEVEP